ncbi:methyl sulfide methyltransferase-associated sensor [Geobacter sp. OR-1]|uniref:PAS domain S-box protein n=1 Tax=Geobacter sp. OR-1 TaxID=1266765 RepID=UPI000542CFD6|nr:PAS domain S-box protein [Geobacter sp. OR-1]GAM10791.1 methyl sulfide methyltransferase-associated sensor [Geobacter sp. OR-1]
MRAANPNSLIHKVRAAIILHDSQGRIMDSNPLAQELLGFSAGQLLGKELIDQEWRFLREDGSVLQVAEYPVSLVLSTRRPLRNHLLGIYRPDLDHALWVLVNAEPEYDDSGEITMIIVSFVDITERKQAEELLRTSLGSYRMAQAISHVGNWEYNLQTTEFWGSDEAKCIYGFDPGQDSFSTDDVEQCITERERVHKALIDLIEAGTPYNLEFEINPRNSSEPKIIASIAELHRDEHGDPLKVIGVIQDITERKRAEEALHRLNRELRAISNCTQILMKASDEQRLLNDLCRIICDEAGYRMAWVGYPENDDVKTIRPVAWAGVEEGYLTEARITWGDTDRGRGPSGKAIRDGAISCIQDFASDPQALPWRDNAAQRGYRSSIALPLKNENETPFGALCIYAAEANAFSPNEIRLLEELAGDLAFGITVLRTRTAVKQTGQDAALMEFALNNVHEAAFLIDEHSHFQYVNKESCRILGYSRDELLGMGVADVDPDFPPERWSEHWKELAAQRTITMEGRHKTRDGRILPVEINANFIKYNEQSYNLALVRDMTDRKRLEQERLAHLRFFESMDQVNRAMQGANDLEQMMSDLLDVVLAIFECDRAWLIHPCDPERPSGKRSLNAPSLSILAIWPWERPIRWTKRSPSCIGWCWRQTAR